MVGKKKSKRKRKNKEINEDDKEKRENVNEETGLKTEFEETKLVNEHKELELKGRSEQSEIKVDSVNMEINEIKSTAVVKYSVPRPPDYIKLQCNTDLNLPPANWLSSSADSYGLQRAFTLTHKGFSSFRMAQLYPDCVGDVDVISDAENIKKLLKIPYTKEVVSMFVHRVGNTLLLDNFDIYKSFFNFARTEDGIFLWLRDFVMKNLSSKALQDERRLYAQDRSREALKHRSLISKFMYHSLDMNKSERMLENEVHQVHSTRSTEPPILPNPSPDVEAPDSTFDDKYNRNVVWTFEDIEMLLGTDMPIFGGGEYPCISLRLRDMQQPINILTGIDYWLDNLMSNVPEVVMCYHLNGFVQKYDLIKTEDLPQLKNSKFSQDIIKDVAQNILSFLKTNATKAGHTYWLFKDKGEEVIKLYDLTCLVPQNDKVQNPFTIPVAMLLYRVARNFMKSERKKSGIIRMLLENCIKLLPHDKYPEIVTSSYFMLSEVYMPFTTNPESPTFDNEDQDRDQTYDSDYEETNEEAIKTLDLESMTENKINTFKPPPPLTDCVEERCSKALCQIYEGLNCLQHFSDEPTEQFPSGMQTAKSSEPIPMGFEKLNKNEGNTDTDKKASKSKKKKNKKQDLGTVLVMNNKKSEPLPTWKQKNVRQDGISWKTHLKILLYEKAILVFATLSEYYYGKEQYGECFRSIRLLARCSLIMKKLRGSSHFSEVCLLGRAGDCCIRIFQGAQEPHSGLAGHRHQIYTHSEKESEMLTQIMMDEDPEDPVYSPNLKCVYECDFETPETVIHLAVMCYEEALKVSKTDNMLRRLGNSLNEAGTYYLNYAKLFDGEAIGTWAKKAETHLLKALDVFEQINDKENMALLNTNLGHMYRLIAFSYSMPGRALTPKEKACYAKSNEYFKTALKTLGKRSTNPYIWDNINWELSSSLFTEACLIHDNPPEDVDIVLHSVTVSNAMYEALKSCDLNENHSKFKQFLVRVASIYCRLASAQRVLYLGKDDPTSRQRAASQVVRFYQMAINYFFRAKVAGGYFRTQMKLFSFVELLAEDATAATKKLEHLKRCLEISIEMNEMLKLLLTGNIEFETSEKTFTREIQGDCNYDRLNPLLEELLKKLQDVLKTGLKILSVDKEPAKDRQIMINIYKNCYRITLSYDEAKQSLEEFMFDTLYRFQELFEIMKVSI